MMKKKWGTLFYILIISGSAAAIYWIVKQGKTLQSPVQSAKEIQSAGETATGSSSREFAGSISSHLTEPIAVLLLQIITIIFFARIFGYIFKKIGQPAVIGEIVAGIILGPSILGSYFPGLTQFLFPPASLGTLNFLSQIGLILYMFIIGMELELKAVGKQAYGAIIISHAGIVIPFTLGMCLAYFIYRDYAPGGTSFLSFSLFMGIAMGITAFPVLARILQEKNLIRTRLGVTALTCAAADDITAWCILAAVIALVKSGSSLSVFYTIGLSVIYVVIMLMVIRPALVKLEHLYNNRGKIRTAIIAILFLMMISSAYIASVIGINSLFGAFIAGIIMPPSISFREIIAGKIEDVSVILLLPLFFVITGLRTQMGLLNESHLWATFGWLIFVAVVGKLGGVTVAARIVGQTWRDSLSIGVLMNTRGLMQLIVLNIGYDLGILSPQIFAMMVLMALVTTFMTGPALDLIHWLMPGKAENKDPGNVKNVPAEK